MWSNFHFNYHPQELHHQVIFEDKFLLVVDKPSGLLTVPGNVSNDSLITRLKKKYAYVNPINRLDISTSGLVLCGKSKEICSSLSNQFMTRTTKKIYKAVLDGIIQKDFGFLNYPLARDYSYAQITNAPMQKVDYENGKKSCTYFKVVDRDFSLNRTHVFLYALTGRTHQLRVHTSKFGYPIVGDRLYGDKIVDECLNLHSYFMEIKHPYFNKTFTFVSEPNFKFSKMMGKNI